MFQDTPPTAAENLLSEQFMRVMLLMVVSAKEMQKGVRVKSCYISALANLVGSLDCENFQKAMIGASVVHDSERHAEDEEETQKKKCHLSVVK